VVPERKAAKNRLHLDIGVGGGRAVPIETRRQRVDAEAGRLAGLGALVGVLDTSSTSTDGRRCPACQRSRPGVPQQRPIVVPPRLFEPGHTANSVIYLAGGTVVIVVAAIARWRTRLRETEAAESTSHDQRSQGAVQ
jgi:hypothetical protein